MRAVEPRQSQLGSFTVRSAVPIVSAMLLLFVAAFSVVTTGCSDSDNGDSGGGNDAAGLGGQTYIDDTLVGAETAVVVVVTRDATTSSPASTGNMLGASAGGPADGLLLVGDSVRQTLAGSYEAADSITLALSSTGGVTFDGTATESFFSGTLVVPGIPAGDVFGAGRQVNAPLINLLGTWEHERTYEIACPGGNNVTFDCTGVTRIRPAAYLAMLDTWESCDGEPYECLLADEPLNDESWSGNTFSESMTAAQVVDGCPVEFSGDLSLTVGATSLSETVEGTYTLMDASCGLPAGTVCLVRETLSASRCVECWDSSCEP